MPWWNDSYFYRRHVSIIAPPEPVPSGHIVTCILDRVLLDNNKTRLDFEDIEVLYETSTGDMLQLHRVVDMEENEIHVVFQVIEALDSNEVLDGRYWIYYGNPDLENTEQRLQPLLPSETLFPDETLYPADGINPWPVGVGATDTSGEGGYGYLTYTRPGEHWLEGVSSTRYARASLLIYATAFRIVSTVNREQAIMEVQIDGGEWQDVDLYSEEEVEYQSVFEAEGLDPDVIHEIRIRVSGRSNIASLGDTINLKGVEYVKPVKAEDAGEEVNEVEWSSYVGGG